MKTKNYFIAALMLALASFAAHADMTMLNFIEPSEKIMRNIRHCSATGKMK